MKTKISLFVLIFLFASMNVQSRNSIFLIPIITVTGGNGTMDGEQVNRDYEFNASYYNGCVLTEFRVLNTTSTSLHSRQGDNLYLVWKSGYAGTTQKIRATCDCNGTIHTTTKNYTLHN